MAHKSKITCFNCGAVYRLDLSKVPPQHTKLRCIKCKSPIPLLDRVLGGRPGAADKAEPEPKDGPAAPAPAAAPVSALDALAAAGVESATLDQDGGDGEGWLALYGDMMSILLIFFILMFAISTINKAKFESVIEAVSKALGGVVQFEKSPAAPPPSQTGEQASRILNELRGRMGAEKRDMAKLERRLKEMIAQERLSGQFSVLDEPDGLVLIAQDQAMFDSGSAELRPHVLPALRKLGMILKTTGNPVVVEGHTDNVPIKTPKFASNWELSAARAITVVHFLTEQSGLDPARVSAAGYAFYRPRHPFNGPDAGKNRRIEIKIVKRYGGEISRHLGAGGPASGSKP